MSFSSVIRVTPEQLIMRAKLFYAVKKITDPHASQHEVHRALCDVDSVMNVAPEVTGPSFDTEESPSPTILAFSSTVNCPILTKKLCRSPATDFRTLFMPSPSQCGGYADLTALGARTTLLMLADADLFVLIATHPSLDIAHDSYYTNKILARALGSHSARTTLDVLEYIAEHGEKNLVNPATFNMILSEFVDRNYKGAILALLDTISRDRFTDPRLGMSAASSAIRYLPAFSAVRRRQLAEVCIGLRQLDLPVLVLLTIFAQLMWDEGESFNRHAAWQVAKRVKFFPPATSSDRECSSPISRFRKRKHESLQTNVALEPQLDQR